MPVTTSIKIPYPTEGMIRSSIIDDVVCPENSVQLGLNGNFDRMGAFTSRKGMTTFATQRAGRIISLGRFAQNSTNNRKLLIQEDNDIYSWDGVTMTNVRTLSSNNKSRYSQFLNLVYTVNGNATLAGSDPIRTYDGATYGSTNIASLPKGDYVHAGFEGRVWVADAALDRLYYSDIVSPSGVIAGGTNYIEKLSPQDGESFTALYRHPRALLVFKQNHIFRVYGASSVDPYPAYNVGTFSQESIVETKDGTYFHHSSGFYKFQYDGQPQEISRRITDFVDAIDRNFYESVTGVWDGKDAVLWSVGTVTVEGVTYSNCELRYTISTQVWTVYNRTGQDQLTASVLYDDGNVVAPIGGTNIGNVVQLEDGNTDLGRAIPYEYITRWIAFIDIWSRIKDLSGITINTENGAGSQLSAQYDKDVANKWDNILAVSENFSTSSPSFVSNEFNRVRFRVVGESQGTPVVLYGIEVRKLDDKGYQEN